MLHNICRNVCRNNHSNNLSNITLTCRDKFAQIVGSWNMPSAHRSNATRLLQKSLNDTQWISRNVALNESPDTGKRSVKACSTAKSDAVNMASWEIHHFCELSMGETSKKQGDFPNCHVKNQWRVYSILEDVLYACSKNVTGEDFKIELRPESCWVTYEFKTVGTIILVSLEWWKIYPHRSAAN